MGIELSLYVLLYLMQLVLPKTIILIFKLI